MITKLQMQQEDPRLTWPAFSTSHGSTFNLRAKIFQSLFVSVQRTRFNLLFVHQVVRKVIGNSKRPLPIHFFQGC